MVDEPSPNVMMASINISTGEIVGGYRGDPSGIIPTLPLDLTIVVLQGDIPSYKGWYFSPISGVDLAALKALGLAAVNGEHVEIVARPTLPPLDTTAIVADDVDAATLPQFPAGTEVYLGEELVGTATEGDAFAFTAQEAGTYALRFAPPFPWQSYRVTVTATEPAP